MVEIIASSLTAFKFWSKQNLTDSYDMSATCHALSTLGLILGSTSEPCLALAHYHDFNAYIEIQPQSLQQHYWVYQGYFIIIAELITPVIRFV